MEIRRKIMIPMIVLTAVCSFAIMLTSVILYNREINNAADAKIRNAMSVVESEIQGFTEKAYTAVIAASKSSDLIEAIKYGDREQVFAAQTNLLEMTDIDYYSVLYTDGIVISRAQEPDSYGDSMARLPHIAAAMNERASVFIMQGALIPLGVSAAAPIYDDDMNFVGIISLGYRLDNPEYVGKLSINTGCEVTIYRDDVIFSTTFLDEDGESPVGRLALETISARVLNGETFIGNINFLGKDYLVKYVPIFGADNTIIGMISVAHDTFEDTTNLMFFITTGGFVTILFLIVCIIIASFISKVVEQRLNKMADNVFEANQRVMLMLDTAPLCIQILSKEFIPIDCNESAVKLFGFKDKQDFLTNFTRYCFPEFQPDGRRSDEKAAEYMKQAFNDGYVNFEWMYKMPSDNTEIPGEVTGVRARYNDEDIIVSYIRDLRDHYKMLKKVEAANFTSKAMFDANPHVNVLFDDKFNVVGCNPEALRFFGFDTNDAFIKGFAKRLQQSIPKHQTDGAPSMNMMEGLRKAAEVGEVIIDSDLSMGPVTRSLNVVLRRIPYDESIAVIAYVQDVTEIREREKELENERFMLQTVFDSIPDLMFTKDADNKFTRFNKSMLSYYNINEGLLLGEKDYGKLGVPDDVKDHYRKVDTSVLKSGNILEGEAYVPNTEGEVRLFETRRIPFSQKGKVTGFIGIARDITERKAMEEAAQSANRSKSIFLANMSHEIRTPMNSIIGFAELAQADIIPEKTRSYLGNIQNSAEWLLKIINDILDISKIESGKITLERIPFNLPDIFSHCQSAIAPKITDKGIMLYCYAEPSVGKKLLGDPVRVRQIIMNLLSNAVKFTNSGTVKMLASIENTTDKTITIKFEVKDSGIGMTAEQIDLVFNPFMQAEESITRRFGGTGLGLTITKGIIELMGGKLHVESVQGVGSKFTFELTFDLIDEIELPSEEIIINEHERPNFEGEILICEDNSLNRQVICDHLERVGLTTVTAENGKDGLDIVANRVNNNEKPFDLIFMDIHMPVMDGLDASEQIMKLGVKTPIIALTANITSNDIELYRANGMQDTVGKPFTTKELWKCLTKYLSVRSFTKINKKEQAIEESKAMTMMKISFVKSNKTTQLDLASAIDKGDYKLAHRIVHTLKSNAGQIGYENLQNTAAELETLILRAEDNEKIDDNKVLMLNNELSNVISELSPLLDEQNEKKKSAENDEIDKEKAIELMNTLQPLLESKDTKCMKLLDELYKIPGTEKLTEDIERYRYKQALKTLAIIREGLLSDDE